MTIRTSVHSENDIWDMQIAIILWYVYKISRSFFNKIIIPEHNWDDASQCCGA